MKKIFFISLLIFTNSILFSQVNEGDTIQFQSVTYVDWPPLWGTPQRTIDAICKKVSEYCYIFVEDSATQPTQAQLDTLVNHFDNKFIPELTALYGPVPNALDNDPKIYILAFNETNWSGYFDPGQQMPDTFVYSHWGMHSNEHELIYFAASEFSYASELVAHEFGHMLHWQQDHSPEPINNPVKYWEEAWIDEGFSTFAAEYLTQNISQQDIMHGAYFVNQPDLPLIYFQNYDQVLMWTVFMYEHFGGEQYIKMLIKEQANGIKGMRKTLDSLGYSESFEDAFEQWIIANYIDNPTFENGKYSYSHFNFGSAKNTFIHNAYPTGIKTQNVNPFGVDYIRFNAPTSGKLSITFNGDSAYKFRLAFILFNNTTSDVKDIITMEPDNNNTLTFNADSFGTTYNRVAMAVMCVDTTMLENSNAGYTYSATQTPSSIDEKKTIIH
ncbi:MAG TPA: hypothetical protein PKK00_11520 [Bacteroidales bacterium]|nr:hypothetical protein [Bacteroidales bacterium]HPS18180.1 hypothetical protein [Bacteroidales bacterium]